MNLEHCREALLRAGVAFEPGLSLGELQAVEQRFGFSFPPDLRHFLAFAVPSGKGFPTWRELDNPKLSEAFSWPYEGMCFDIEHNAFWPHQWGERPPDLLVAFELARGHIARAPVLIPICGHRYLPATPCIAGNPVFSVYQTDIIVYGADLEDYLRREFRYYFGKAERSLPGNPREIDFWSWLVELNE